MYSFCPNCGSGNLQISQGFCCKKCKKTFYQTSKPTVTIIPLYKNEMLVTIRGIKPHKGRLDFVGGFLENGEDPLDGGMREFKEETGVSVKKKDLKYLGIWIDDYEFEGINYKTFNVIYTCKFFKKVLPKGRDDVAELFWMPVKIHKNFAFSWMKKAVNAILSQSTG